ncbi:uncharacterized protein NPIL_401551 [Nephila pilipes]|uniref:Uncharacterized protein n=1 Tax=Nephila pilipes TaxID=299642 RepID=A0A8X6Q093_NEPPI|nr:uncharacterized protein NPIL_401551 [Nephila pilipes]
MPGGHAMCALLKWKKPCCKSLAIPPSTSTRVVAAELDVLYTVVWNVLHTAKIYPFHIQKVQLPTGVYYPHHEQLMRWMLDVTTHSKPQFPATVLFTDADSFTREGFVGTHNAHMWTMDNSHASVPWKSQQRFNVNMWQESSVIIS